VKRLATDVPVVDEKFQELYFFLSLAAAGETAPMTAKIVAAAVLGQGPPLFASH
jgi:hypothetical protein